MSGMWIRQPVLIAVVFVGNGQMHIWVVAGDIASASVVLAKSVKLRRTKKTIVSS